MGMLYREHPSAMVTRDTRVIPNGDGRKAKKDAPAEISVATWNYIIFRNES